MKKQALTAIRFLLSMMVLTGILYPFIMTGISQLIYPGRSNGSLIVKDGKVIGSELIGQTFDSSIYFWGRPSATGYNPVPSSGTNYGPTSDTLIKLVTLRRNRFAKANSISDESSVPEEMVFASGSGLDPHISVLAALMQADRVSEARYFDNNQRQRLLQTISKLTEGPQYFCLGEERINVLILNLELNKIEENNTNNK